MFLEAGAFGKMILVTGSAGFIGSNFVLDWIREKGTEVVSLDKLTYAGNLENLAALEGNPKHVFVRGDIGDTQLVAELLERNKPQAIVNFAAESHVDRSIHGPAAFIETNIVGTFHLLEAARSYWEKLDDKANRRFVFCMFQRMRCMARWKLKTLLSLKRRPIVRTALIQLLKRPQIISCAPIIIPMASGFDDELLEQLRAISISRKAYSVDDF